MKIDIKPLSVNECWQGRRFKTDSYKSYEFKLLLLLPKIKLPDPPFEAYYTFGLSNNLGDADNLIKPFQDILSKKYGFNDRVIHRIIIEKIIVQKGSEYVQFEFKHYETTR